MRSIRSQFCYFCFYLYKLNLNMHVYKIIYYILIYLMKIFSDFLSDIKNEGTTILRDE